MPTVAHALTTLAKVKSLLGITDTSKDALLEGLIDAVTDFIESFCGRRFINGTDQTEFVDGTGAKRLVTRNRPIVSITKIEERSDAATFGLVDSDTYYFDPATGLIETDFLTLRGVNTYKLTYKAGYADLAAVPNDLQQAAAELVIREYNQRQGGGDIESERVGDYSVTYGQGGSGGSEADKFVDGTLARYKNWKV